VSPADYVKAGDQFTLTTADQLPNRQVDFYVAGSLVGSQTTDGAGRASIAAVAPASVALIDVAVAGPCGTVNASVRSGGVAAAEFGRGFARTGLNLLPWLIAALVCIVVGRELRRRARRPTRAQMATRIKLPRI
jgi:hypothetical protein